MINTWTKDNTKPEIVGLVEEFEKTYIGQASKSELLDAACNAVAIFLFGPVDDQDLAIYKQAIKLRVEKYRSVVN